MWQRGHARLVSVAGLCVLVSEPLRLAPGRCQSDPFSPCPHLALTGHEIEQWCRELGSGFA